MRKLWLVFSQATTVALALLFVLMVLKPGWLPGWSTGSSTGAPISVTTMAAPPTAMASGVSVSPVSFAAAARRAAPAVVSITASKAPARSPHADDPWFRYFFGDRGDGGAPQVGLGSGVIVSTEGYLLTNNHVVEGADEIEVQLADGREARARLVGTDPETDVAVLKIDLPRLPVLAFGAVESLQVGDVVLAIGNPFNVGQTVTSGIVSALGRNQLGLSTFENFIQTDAAINPGNSGGALVDAYGNLVGINTAIYSRTGGGSMGIGFAIPVDLARQVMESLVADGQVTRGWIGVQPRDMTPEFAASFKLPVDSGVLITGVLQDGPASRAGMRPGDVVVKVAGHDVANTRDLMNSVAALKPRTEAVVDVQRGAQKLALKIVVGQRPKSSRTEQ